MTALVDADVIVYQAGFAAQSNVYSVEWHTPDAPVGQRYHQKDFEYKKEANEFVNDMGFEYEIVKTVIAEPVQNALHNVKLCIEKIERATKCDELVLFLSGTGNYRLDIFPAYKANRDPNHKPVHYQAIKDYMIGRLGAVIIHEQEADDQLGIEQMKDMRSDNEFPQTCICTIDKDLTCIPGLHYNWTKDELGVVMVFPEEALDFFYEQLLTGDSTDGIPGLFKLTGQRALPAIKQGLLDQVTEVDKWKYVVNLYENGNDKKRVKEEELITIARLLWIRQQENEMWTPPNDSMLMDEIY
jgi:5'-3' exonuclease